MTRAVRVLGLSLLVCGLAGCNRAGQSAPSPLDNPAAVTAERLLAAAGDGTQWIMHGGDYSGQRFSRLGQIDAGNVARLGLAWSADYGTGVEQHGAPLYIDGIVYVPVSGDGLVALEALAGKLLWRYDAGSVQGARQPCCADAGRGIAAYQGRIIMGTLDARLVAIDARTGSEAWSTAVPDQSAITMAPRVAQGKVFVGGWSTEAGVRGWMAAFDADTGREVWRFHNVPGDPSQGFENEAMKRAAVTWGAEQWKSGGGGVRDGAVYDAAAGYLIYGTGGAPGNAGARGPGGDALYAASIIALKADSGEYVWHYQIPPTGNGLHDAAGPMITMDLLLVGKPRHVLTQPNANGFLYLLDVVTGELLGAEAFRDERKGSVWPASAHDPGTGLMYIAGEGRLEAWDPAAHRRVWEMQDVAGGLARAGESTVAGERDGGMLATAGGLVFSAADTVLRGHDARTGQQLWSHDAQSAIHTAPISYELDGRQYIAVSVGGAKPGSDESGAARLLVFALEGGSVQLDQQGH